MLCVRVCVLCVRRGAEQPLDHWQRLEPQIKDVLKVLWQGDLTSEGIYLNIATYIRKFSSRLLMVRVRLVQAPNALLLHWNTHACARLSSNT